MTFEGPGTPITEAGLVRVCDVIGCDRPTLWAVLSVETKGFGFLHDRRPVILFERHVFHQRTRGQFDADHPDLSSAARGGYASGVAEHERLARAIALDEEAALASASWGVGQVMGFNHEAAGFADVHAMVDAMVADEDAQLLAAAQFIHAGGLAAALRANAWDAFARGYNGPKYTENEYPQKLATFYQKYQAAMPDLRLRTVQAALLYLGFDPGGVDGIAGKSTRAAVRAFQAQHTLPESGEVDSLTEATLLAAAFPAVGDSRAGSDLRR
jgi:hypothetical protein